MNVPNAQVRWSIVKAISARIRWLVQRYFWGMDVASSAQIEPSAYIDRTWPKGVHIGEACYIGEDAVILTHDMSRGVYFDTRLGCGVVVGHRAVVMPGLEVGDHCYIQPGALVTKNMPPWSTALGNPAKISLREEDPVKPGSTE